MIDTARGEDILQAKSEIAKLTKSVSEISPEEILSSVALSQQAPFLNQLPSLIESAVEHKVSPLKMEVMAHQAKLRKDKQYFSDRAAQQKNSLEKIPEFIEDPEAKGGGWTRYRVVVLSFLVLFVSFAGFIELYLSFKMLSTSIPVFEKYPAGALVLGIVPLLLAVIMKWSLQEHTNIGYSKHSANRVFAIVLVIIFAGLQFVIYQMQAGVSTADIFQEPSSDSSLSDFSAIEDFFSSPRFDVDYDAMYYSFASLIVYRANANISVFPLTDNCEILCQQ